MPAFIIANTLYSPSHIELRQAAALWTSGQSTGPLPVSLHGKRPVLTRVTAMQAGFSYNLHK